jgi:hypothetical protein
MEPELRTQQELRVLALECLAQQLERVGAAELSVRVEQLEEEFAVI